MNWDMEVDVLAVGGGACGLAAAIAAHDEGLNAAVLEKLERPGGNTALSTGSVPGAGSRFQREAGIEDSVEKMLGDYLRRCAWAPKRRASCATRFARFRTARSPSRGN